MCVVMLIGVFIDSYIIFFQKEFESFKLFKHVVAFGYFFFFSLRIKHSLKKIKCSLDSIKHLLWSLKW